MLLPTSEKLFTESLDTPIGPITVTANEQAIVLLSFEALPSKPNALTNLAVLQLTEYFNHQRTTFDLPLAPAGTEFQQQVYHQLLRIPFGETITYLALASRMGNKKSVRAAAAANGKNPIPILIPCHRVIGSGGKLVGYLGGLQAKQFLLHLETKLSLF